MWLTLTMTVYSVHFSAPCFLCWPALAVGYTHTEIIYDEIYVYTVFKVLNSNIDIIHGIFQNCIGSLKEFMGKNHSREQKSSYFKGIITN